MVRGDPSVVREHGVREVKGVRIEGVQTFHDTESGAKRGGNLVFVFDLDGMRFVHCGDLGHQLSEGQLAAIGRPDFLFLPVGGTFTLDHEGARRLVDAVRPRVAVPMHFFIGGMSINIDPVGPFLKGVPEESVLRVGNEIEFSREDLPSTTEYWVFSP